MKNKLQYSNESSLIMAIIFLLLGMVLFTNPGGVVKFISYIAGTLLIIMGLVSILSYQKTLKNLNIQQTSKLASGIVLIILGLISILFASVIETVLRLIIGAWIIYSGVIRMIDVINNKVDKVSFIVRLVISILLIICGFYTVLKTNLAFKGIGLLLILYAIMEIIGYITYSSKTKKK